MYLHFALYALAQGCWTSFTMPFEITHTIFKDEDREAIAEGLKNHTLHFLLKEGTKEIALVASYDKEALETAMLNLLKDPRDPLLIYKDQGKTLES